MSKINNKLTDEQKRNCINRIKKLTGQANGIINMIETDRDSEEIINQIAAISSATKNLGKELLLSHIKNTIPEKELKASEASLEECVKLLKYFS